MSAQDLERLLRQLSERRVSVSVEDAAQMMGVSKDAIRYAIQTGQLRSRKLGRRVLVSVKGMHEFMGDEPKSRTRAR